MDQNNPNDSGFNSGINSTTGGVTGTTGSGSTASGSSFATGGTGSGMSSGGTMSSGSGANSGGIGVTSASETGTGTASRAELCPHCGQTMKGGGLDQFLGRLGINDEMIDNLRSQFQNVDIDEYITTARDYLKDSSGKATTYAKEHPGKVAAGVAALALGAGLIFASVNREK